MPVTKTGEIDYKSPEYLAAFDAETTRVSTEQMHRVYSLRERHEEAQATALRLKRELEDTRNGLFKYLKEREETRGKRPNHLFAAYEAEQTIEANKPQPSPGPEANASGAAAVNGQTPAALPEPKGPANWFPDDLWKQYPIDRLTSWGLSPTDVEKLKAGATKSSREPFPVETMGDLARYSTPTDSGYTRRVADFKGFGPAGVERLEKAGIEFWQQWPSLAEAFAVEKGHRRPDHLAHDPAIDGPAAAAEATPPADAPPAKKTKRKKGATSADSPEPVAGSAGGDRAAGDGHGDGVNGVPGADYRHPSAYIPDAPQEAGAGEVP